MPGNIDLLTTGFRVDYNPTNHMSSDPTYFIQHGAGLIAEIIGAIPAMIVDLVTSIITDPGQLTSLLLEVPESFLGLSKYTGLPNLGLGVLGDLGSFIPGLGSGNILTIAETFINDILTPTGLLATAASIFDELISIIPGATTGLSGSSGLGSIFTDLTHVLGSPTALGSGSPVLPGIGSIPLLGGLLSGGLLLASLIPGLDTSKIISGTFPASMITGLAAASMDFISLVTAFIPGYSGTDQSAAHTDFNSLAGNILGLMGSPTAMLTTPVLPGIGSIPLLGGLLSGTTFLTSLIPGLDASKIISGAFPQSMITGLSALLSGFAGTSSIISQLLGLWPHTTTGLSGLTGLQSVYTDLMGLLGSPTALGSGSPVLPAIGSIPVLGGLLSGATLLTSLIPGLDASKIISGSFPQSMITGLVTLLSGFAGGSSILAQLIAQWPNITTGLSGLTGLNSIYADLTHVLGSPTALGSGSPVLPGIGSIPLLGGLLSGSTFLSSLIPNLDASKLTTGTLLASLFPTITPSMTSGLAPIDTLIQAWGGIGSGFLPADLATFAAKISHDYVVGTLGGNNIANTIQNLLDGGVGGVQNNPALSNQTIAQWSNALTSAMGFLGYNPAGATPPNSVAAITSNTDATLKGRAVQKDPNANIDRTLDATFDLKEVMTQSTLPVVAVTQGNPMSAPINIRDGGQKQTIAFKGYLTGTLTKCYINLYYVSPTTGVWTWFYSTADYHASIATGTTPQYNFIPIPAAQYVNTAVGDIIQAEIVVYGSGTLNIVGKTLSNQLLPMTGIFPGFPAAQRLATTAPTYITSQANMGFGNGGSGTVTVDQACSDTGAMLIFRMYRTTNTGAGGLTVGGQGVTSVGGADNYFLQSGVQSFWAEMFYIKNPPAGAQTLSAAGGSGVTNINVGIIQLANVGSIQGFSQVNGTSANPAYTIPAGFGATNTITVAAFASDAGSVTGTTGFTNSVVNNTSYELAMGTVNFDAAAHPITMVNASSGQWAMQICNITGVPLQPTTGFTVANPSAPGATGVPAAYNRLQPWLGLSGAAAVTAYSPVVDPYATPGSGISIQNPAVKYPWANNFDIVMCADGSGGEGGGYPVGGVGGKAGTWTRQTLTRTQIGTSNLTLNIGGGSAGTSPGVGGSSGSTGVSAVVPGFGTISQPGVAGSGSGLSPSAYGVAGDSPGNFTYTDANGVSVTFVGGAGGSGGQAPGGQPGGGGSGGNATYMPNFNGGPGGAAEVWIRSYQ